MPAGTKELFFFSPLLQGKQRSTGACQLEAGDVALMDFCPCPAQLSGKRGDAQPSPFLPGIKQPYSILQKSETFPRLYHRPIYPFQRYSELE